MHMANPYGHLTRQWSDWWIHRVANVFCRVGPAWSREKGCGNRVLLGNFIKRGHIWFQPSRRLSLRLLVINLPEVISSSQPTDWTDKNRPPVSKPCGSHMCCCTQYTISIRWGKRCMAAGVRACLPRDNEQGAVCKRNMGGLGSTT